MPAGPKNLFCGPLQWRVVGCGPKQICFRFTPDHSHLRYTRDLVVLEALGPQAQSESLLFEMIAVIEA